MSSADRGTWRLIARRDFWVRLRERSFVISTLLWLNNSRHAHGASRNGVFVNVVLTAALLLYGFLAYEGVREQLLERLT